MRTLKTLSALTVGMVQRPSSIFVLLRRYHVAHWVLTLQLFRWLFTSATTVVHLYVHETPMLLPPLFGMDERLYRYYEIFLYAPYGFLIILTISWHLAHRVHSLTGQPFTFLLAWQMVGISYFLPWLPTLPIDNLLIQNDLASPFILIPWHILILGVESALLVIGLQTLTGLNRKAAVQLAAECAFIFLAMAGALIR
ncbi:MAG: hypothetical protein HQL50_03015 [Magnetococcales bacterium]|nr:hypothetical protein [Magnetococcales bacterium]